MDISVCQRRKSTGSLISLEESSKVINKSESESDTMLMMCEMSWIWDGSESRRSSGESFPVCVCVSRVSPPPRHLTSFIFFSLSSESPPLKVCVVCQKRRSHRWSLVRPYVREFLLWEQIYHCAHLSVSERLRTQHLLLNCQCTLIESLIGFSSFGNFSKLCSVPPTHLPPLP